MPRVNSELLAWEAAEVARSATEASRTPDHRLLAGEANVARYLAPPIDTAFPLEYAYALLGDVRGRVVLDYGCGSGENTLLLAKRGARIIAVDISRELIDLARRRLSINGLDGAATFLVASAHELPVKPMSVDVVFGIAVLHHLDLGLASREVHRVLKRGGRGIFQEPVRDSRVIRSVRALIPYRAPDVSPFERPLTAVELRQFSAPFRSNTVRGFSLPFVNVTQVTPVLRRYVMGAYRLDRAVLRRFPLLMPYTGTRVIEVVK